MLQQRQEYEEKIRSKEREFEQTIGQLHLQIAEIERTNIDELLLLKAQHSKELLRQKEHFEEWIASLDEERRSAQRLLLSWIRNQEEASGAARLHAEVVSQEDRKSEGKER